jgi:hypothetical protein
LVGNHVVESDESLDQPFLQETKASLEDIEKVVPQDSAATEKTASSGTASISSQSSIYSKSPHGISKKVRFVSQTSFETIPHVALSELSKEEKVSTWFSEEEIRSIMLHALRQSRQIGINVILPRSLRSERRGLERRNERLVDKAADIVLAGHNEEETASRYASISQKSILEAQKRAQKDQDEMLAFQTLSEDQLAAAATVEKPHDTKGGPRRRRRKTA